MKRKFLAGLLSLCMIFSLMPMSVFAEGATVAKIGENSYTDFATALTAANAMTDDVTVEIYDKVTLNSNLSGSYDSITFVGKDIDAEIYLDVQGYITAPGKRVAFEDLILSKSEGGFITNAGFMNVAFGIYDVSEVTYTNCTFANGAYASSGEVTFKGCTFYRSWDKYGLWAYGDVEATVDGCTFADYRGIKMYAEGAAKTTDLTVKNTDFSAVTAKPAIVLTYGESVALENNTYSSTGVFELDKDGAPNGTPVVSDVAPTCVNDDGACGVLVDGKIYTTVEQAAAVATSGSTVTLLHDYTETVEFPAGVTLELADGVTAENVTVAAPVATVNGTQFGSLQAAVAAANGATVILVSDATENVLVEKDAVIDLGGKTLNGSIKVKESSNAKVTIKNGTINNTDNNVSAVEAHGDELTLENVNIDSARHAVRVEAGKLVINSGNYTVTSPNTSDAKTTHVINIGTTSGAAVEAVINDGTFTGPRGKTTTGTEDDGAALNVQTTAKVTVKGGKFSGGQNNTIAEKIADSVTLEGGTYDQNPTAYLASGYEAVEKTAGEFTVGLHAPYEVAEDPATCTSTGTAAHYKCDFCEKTFSDAAGTIEYTPATLGVISHTPAADPAVAPGCTTTGLTAGEHCSVCGTVTVAQQVVEKTAHPFGGWYTVKEPVCHDAGYEARVCSACGETESRALNATAHNFDVNGVCAICGHTKAEVAAAKAAASASRTNPNTGVHF